MTPAGRRARMRCARACFWGCGKKSCAAPPVATTSEPVSEGNYERDWLPGLMATYALAAAAAQAAACHARAAWRTLRGRSLSTLADPRLDELGRARPLH